MGIERRRTEDNMWQQTAVGVLAVVVLLCTIRAHAIEGVEDRPLNVLLVTYPFSMLHPTVALAVEMCRRGHHTVIAGHDGKVQRQVDKVNASYREELAAGCGAIEFQSLGKMPFSDAEVKDIRKKVSDITVKHQQMAVGMELYSTLDDHVGEHLPAVLSQLEPVPDVAFYTMGGGPKIPLVEAGIPGIMFNPAILIPAFQSTDPWVPFLFYSGTVSEWDNSFFWRVVVYVPRFAMETVRRVSYLVGVTWDHPMLVPLDESPPMVVSNIAELDFSQAVRPNVRYTGPLLLPTQLPLADETSQWISSLPQKATLVYVSMGTVAWVRDKLAMAILDGLLGRRIDTYILWALPQSRFEELTAETQERIEELKGSGRLLARSWVAGPAAMAHPRTDLFITHCGANSLLEALSFALPMVGIPHFGDQFGNCVRAQEQGALAAVQRSELSGEAIAKAAEEMLTDEARNNAARMARLMKNAGGVAAAADVVETVGMFGERAYQGPTHRMGWIKRESWDTFSFLMLICFLVLFAGLHLCKFGWRLCCGRPQRESKTKVS